MAKNSPYFSIDRMQERIVNILNKLDAEDQAKDETIQQVAYLLVNAAGYGPDKGHPHTLQASTKTTKKELATIRKHATNLLNALDEMHAPAAAALCYPPLGDNNNLGIQLRLLLAQFEVIDAGDAPDLTSDATGAPENARARRATKITANVYKKLTGKKAANWTNHHNEQQPNGPFVALLEDIFKVLDICASAEHFARQLNS